MSGYQAIRRGIATSLSLLFLLGGCVSSRRSHFVVRTDQLNGRGIVRIASRYVGTPYRYGGKTPAGFDCSGYVRYVYARAGFRLPGGSRKQFRSLYTVRVPQPGDLVFFRTQGRNISHVGIYVGHYRFLHSPRTGKRVGYADIRKRYWSTRYAGARTVFSR